MGNCLSSTQSAVNPNAISKNRKALPIDASFKLPAPLPSWPPGCFLLSGSELLQSYCVALLNIFLYLCVQVKVLGMGLLILEMDYRCASYLLSTKFGPHMKEDQIISVLPSLNPHNFRKVSPCLVPTANPTTHCYMGGFFQ